MGLNLASAEKIVLPIVCPLFLELWSATILPAIQAAAKSASPEIQILETAGADFLDIVVKAEIAKLATV